MVSLNPPGTAERARGGGHPAGHARAAPEPAPGGPHGAGNDGEQAMVMLDVAWAGNNSDDDDEPCGCWG